MLTDDIADRLEDLGIATKGTDLFKSMDPGSTDRAVTVYAMGGGAPMDAMGANAVTLEQPAFRVVVRAPTMSEVESRINAVVTGLHKYVGTINTVRYLYIRVLTSPVDVGPDERGRPRMAVTFRAVKEMS